MTSGVPTVVRRPSALLVDTDESALTLLREVLGGAGYRCATSPSFADARFRLAGGSPDLLVTAARLDDGSGLDLVLQRHLNDQPSIVIDGAGQPANAGQARLLHATYLVKPLRLERIIEAVTGLPPIAREAERREWPRAALTDGVPIPIDGTQATLVDVSYGGFCLEMDASARETLPPRIPLSLAPLSFTVSGRVVWHVQTAGRAVVVCGLSVVGKDASTAKVWKRWVDGVAPALRRATGASAT